MKSKHFRPKEHYWYFTRQGFIDYMKQFKFKLFEIRNDEIAIGREDIVTFVFKR